LHAFCSLVLARYKIFTFGHMIDQDTFEHLLPFAYQWAKATEELTLACGAPLSSRHMADARLAGVQDCSKIRVLVVDRIPMPENRELAEAARHTGIITDDTRCVGFGHAVIIRADSWGDRELLLHNLVHIAQCERSGGLEPWVRQYIGNRRDCAHFTIGSLEEEARRRAREICAADAVASQPVNCSTSSPFNSTSQPFTSTP
jgi:hypothetical protein